ncbi:MAG: recombinase family protein [Candidatus Limiplasma sp.]|nr:recombinase family protein [Candidatus Limiplasma sp.]
MSIDRPGRNHATILNEWKHITQEKHVNIKVLDMPLLDTTKTAADNLDGQFIARLVLEILSYVAEKERVNTKARQRQGIDRALEQGKHIGRPAVTYPVGFANDYEQWKGDKMVAKDSMNLLGLQKLTFISWSKNMQKTSPKCFWILLLENSLTNVSFEF